MKGKKEKPEKTMEHRHVTEGEAMNLVAGLGSSSEKVEDGPLYKIRNCLKCWEEWHHIL